MSDLTGPVHVVGSGLLGTSVALACRRSGLEVFLSDRSPEHLRTASGLGAGHAYDGSPVQLVVVAVPPDHLGATVVRELSASDAVVTDVGSIKGLPLAEARGTGADLGRYVGGHPMAGSERSGPLTASATLFEGRPWAVTPHETSTPAALAAVRALVALCGGVEVLLTPEEHDLAVARTSHLPHLMAALVAGRLAGASADHLALSGQGVRDVTRIAGGDPALWEQIIVANGPAVLTLLDEVAGRLGELRAAVADGARAPLTGLLRDGVAGTLAIPGKHGGPLRPTASVYVAVPDHPGELARLFADAGEIGVNIEDVHIDHDPGRPVGQVELVVEVERAGHLTEALGERAWTVHL